MIVDSGIVILMVYILSLYYLNNIIAVMFKKSARLQSKNTNIKNLKAAFNKCLSHRDASGRLHSRSMVEYPDDKKQDQTLPIYENVIDKIQHSHSHFAFTAKDPLKCIAKESFNRSYSRGKFNLEMQANLLPNLKKPSQKKGFNQTGKRIVAQPDDNKLNLARMRLSDNKENIQILQENRKLKVINQHMEQQNKLLIETLKKYEARDKSLTSQLRQNKSCSEHCIIIQSLKKVIDSQLQKIIQLEREIIISNQNKEIQKQRENDEKYRDVDKNREKPLVDDCTPSFPPSSPHKGKPLDQSNNSTEEDINFYIEYIDTFRKERQKIEEIGKNQKIPGKQKLGNLSIDTSPLLADELLCQIDDCLDSLSRRRRQVI